MYRSIAIVIAAKATLAAGLALGFLAAPHGVVQAEPTTSCPYEDGDPDGTPCMWTDPDPGAQYYVNSDNYRADGDLTYCPKDGVWSRTWHWCGDGPDPGPYAYDAGVFVGGYN
jgi:hypothetical protein